MHTSLQLPHAEDALISSSVAHGMLLSQPMADGRMVSLAH